MNSESFEGLTIVLKHEPSFLIQGLPLAMKQHHLTYRELAKHTGTSIGYLSDVAHGRRTITETNKRKLLGAIYGYNAVTPTRRSK